MPVPISNVTRRQVYAPSGAGGAGPYAFTFEILANTDIAVFKDNTLLTLTTHYTVVINANGTGSVTITATGLALAPLSPTQYAIVGNRTIARATDFTTGGDFFANTLNDELDQQTIFAQQNSEGLNRALQAPQTDPTTINMTLPAKATRANKTLAFDNDGNPTSGVSASDVANAITYATNAANSATASAASAAAAASSASSASGSASTASTQATNAAASASSATSSASSAGSSASTAGTQASNASTSATNAAASASAASTSASNASTSATTATTQATNAASSATSANTAKVAAEAARDSALAAYDNFDDRYLGPYASNPTVDNDGNTLLAGALYFNTVVPEMRLWTGSAWVAAYVSGTGFLASTNNLSELTATASTARTNLGLGTAAVVADSTLVHTSGNETIAGTKTFSSDASINGLTVGEGGGSVATNTAVGASALAANTTGSNNTAIGGSALSVSTTVGRNTAIGYVAGSATTTGHITAVGAYALYSNTTGDSNVAVGGNNESASAALQTNTTGSNNTAVGVSALQASTTGGNNTAIGKDALYANTTASNNVALGYQAGNANVTGANCTYIGSKAGFGATGTANTCLGDESGFGANTLTSGTNNVYLGYGASGSASGNNYEIVIGGSGNIAGKGSSTGFIAPGSTSGTGGGAVYQGNNSSSWSTTSDRRLKKNIVDNKDGLEKITQIRVRNFEYRLPEEVTELDSKNAIAINGVQLGAIAQEIKEILPDCVKTESTGVMSVDATNLTWYLINAVKELSARVKQLEGN